MSHFYLNNNSILMWSKVERPFCTVFCVKLHEINKWRIIIKLLHYLNLAYLNEMSGETTQNRVNMALLTLIWSIEHFTHVANTVTCKFSVSLYVRKEFNSHRIGLVHPHGLRSNFLLTPMWLPWSQVRTLYRFYLYLSRRYALRFTHITHHASRMSES